MNDAQSKLVDKIGKLLALAGNNDSAAQAEAALAKAQELAIANGIDLSKISKDTNARKQEAEIVCEYMRFGARLPTVSDYVRGILVKFFKVKILLYGNREKGRGILFVGRRQDVETAKYIYNWLSDKMVACWHSYYTANACKGVKLAQKQSYLYGFYSGLMNKLASNQTEVESNLLPDADSRNQYALAVVNNEQAIDAHIQKTIGEVGRKPAKNINIDGQSHAAGYREGERCNIVKGGLAASQNQLSR